MVYEETVRTMKEVQVENDKLCKKLEVLTKEYYTTESSLEKRVLELEVLLQEKNVKLNAYEKMEGEMDELVMQSAVGDAAEGPDLAAAAELGTGLPTSARRRVRQSVELARKVLQLERATAELE